MVNRQQQSAFEESPVQDEVLVAALQDWQACKERLKGPRKAFNAINGTVKSLIEQKELPDGSYRCGEFVITIREAEEKHIEFERSSSKRVSIKPAKTK